MRRILFVEEMKRAKNSLESNVCILLLLVIIRARFCIEYDTQFSVLRDSVGIHRYERTHKRYSHKHTRTHKPYHTMAWHGIRHHRAHAVS